MAWFEMEGVLTIRETMCDEASLGRCLAKLRVHAQLASGDGAFLEWDQKAGQLTFRICGQLSNAERRLLRSHVRKLGAFLDHITWIKERLDGQEDGWQLG